MLSHEHIQGQKKEMKEIERRVLGNALSLSLLFSLYLGV